MPHFRSAADDQARGSGGDGLGEVRWRLRDVFTPARPASDQRVFAGRTEILSALIRAIEETHLHIVLYGERGVGKTSVLNILSQAARKARYRVIYMPCDARTEFDDVFRSVASKIPLLFHGGVEPTAPEAEAGKSLLDVLPAEPLTARVVSDAFANIVSTRVIVFLDEFDRSEDQRFRHSVTELLKMLSDRAARMQLVIAGVATDLKELLEHVPSVQRNIFALHLPRMTADEIRQLIDNCERVAGLVFEKAAVEAVVSIVDGFPYFANLLCHYASLHALDDGRTNVVSDDVLAGLRNCLMELEGRVSRRSHGEIAICTDAGYLPALYELSRVALLADGSLDSENIRRFVSAPQEVPRCENVLRDLLSRELLIEAVPGSSPSAYRFIDGNVAPYLWFKAAESSFPASGPDEAEPQLARPRPGKT